MSFVEYINKSIVLIFLLVITPISSASVVDKKCGVYTYRVKITKGSNVYDTQFDLYYQSVNQEPILFYRAKSLLNLISSCIQDSKGHYLFLFKESYGGNSGPEDIYGIFDPNIKKILINPADWPHGNDKQVKKIIGYHLPSMAFDKRTFCCSGEQIDQ